MNALITRSLQNVDENEEIQFVRKAHNLIHIFCPLR
jgi:hypothetical protein